MPLTPFGRTVSAVVMQQQPQDTVRAIANTPINKWDILRELACARTSFDLSDRDLCVLQALLSFHPELELNPQEPTIIYPSNRAICERLNGMADSTMRRHLKKLIDAGLLIRRDSPNGKRYARSFCGDKIAYGFDLSPLPRQMDDISTAAHKIRSAAETLRRARETVSLMRRDLSAMATYGAQCHPDMALWDQLSDMAALTARALRRKLPLIEIRTLETKLTEALATARAILDPDPTESARCVSTSKMSSNGVENEHHHQNSNKEYIDSETERTALVGPIELSSRQLRLKSSKETVKPADAGKIKTSPPSDTIQKAPQPLPLPMILSVCGEIQSFTQSPIRHWPEFIKAAAAICPMIGITAQTWEDAMRQMGSEQAAITVAAILERFGDIKNPGGYLRYLTQKARAGQFTPSPMITALMKREERIFYKSSQL